jgi:hypothetical protein
MQTYLGCEAREELILAISERPLPEYFEKYVVMDEN